MSYFNFDNFYETAKQCDLAKWVDQLQTAVQSAIIKPDGNLPKWVAALESLPTQKCNEFKLDKAAVTATADNIGKDFQEKLKNALMQLKPWRKGPFNLCGVEIDSEWRSDLKWDRVAPHISPLKERKILDIGCGNGYHMFRMAAEQAKLVVGIDPSMLFLAQFTAINKYMALPNVFLLPIGFESLPQDMEAFDTVFSMGVFYHRRSPFDFLRALKSLLRKDGELILETLIIKGDRQQTLVPLDRYARMNNVWFIPSADAMAHWLEKSGFKDIKVVDIAKTTTEEQRSTEWMPGESLAQCLNPLDQNTTVEGLPAPLRAVFTAKKPNCTP